MIIKPKKFNPGDKSVADDEPVVSDVSFNIFKFNKRSKPIDPKDILIICCFSEFGCETVGVMYCIPRLLQKYSGKYVICVGWYGREYLYRHLADEFWELKEEFQWLREYARAFHNQSKNLKRIEESLHRHGRLITSDKVGFFAVGNVCQCGYVWPGNEDKCPKCSKTEFESSLFGRVDYWRKHVLRIPFPSGEVLKKADAILKSNPVGIFARGRKCYGRNLQPEFYVKLIRLLEGMGYNPIWMGEKQSTQECPLPHVVDFSRMPESRNLEMTLAILAKCKFTVQYWTASTRLASMMGTPYILFESPDQIWGMGQEGLRRKLCDFGPSKLVVAHYKSVFEDNERGLQLTRRAIEELESGNYSEIFGMLETDIAAQAMKKAHEEKYAGNTGHSQKSCR